MLICALLGLAEAARIAGCGRCNCDVDRPPRSPLDRPRFTDFLEVSFGIVIAVVVFGPDLAGNELQTEM